MNDKELLQSAGLYGRDMATGEKGYNLAAIMLLGKDDVILNVCPTYETDALVRKINLDRYDDREIVRTNLIESYEQLMEFAKKNLPDKFFLEDTNRMSLRNVLAREMLSNTLMHREFSSSYAAKFVIEQERMYVENANRAVREGKITPDNLEPNPKNPIIASFFRNIGRADRLGSGVRNLFKYSKFYSGQEPQFIEGDVFKIMVPLDISFSYDFGSDVSMRNNKMPAIVKEVPMSADNYEKSADKISAIVEEVPISADNYEKSADKMPAIVEEVPVIANNSKKSADKMPAIVEEVPMSADNYEKSADKMPAIVKEVPMSANSSKKSADNKCRKQQRMILRYIEEKGKITTKEAEKLLSVKERRARSILAELVKAKILLKQRSYRSVFYVKGK